MRATPQSLPTPPSERAAPDSDEDRLRWDDTTRPVVRDVRTYEADPSGTAVTALLIALIALAVALYAAFAPRQIVNEGARAVMAPLEKAAAGHPQTAGVHPKGALEAQRSLSPDQIRAIAAKEMKQQIAALEKDIEKLRAEIQSGGEPAPVAPAKQPTAGHAGSQ